MRAHCSELDDTLLSAEKRVRAIKLRLQSLIADQLSVASSSARSSPLSSTTNSSDSASCSSNVSQSQPKTKPHCLTPSEESHTQASVSPVTPPLALPSLPPPSPPASKVCVQNVSSQGSVPLPPPSPPTVKPVPKQNTASSTAPPSRSQLPPPPPPPPPNLVHRVSSNRRKPPPPPLATCTITTEPIEEEQSTSSLPPQSRIEKKLDALHAALTTALSLLQSQTATVAITPGTAIDAPTPLKKRPPPEHAVKVFDARQQMLEELKKKIGKRQKAAEEGAISNY